LRRRYRALQDTTELRTEIAPPHVSLVRTNRRVQYTICDCRHCEIMHGCPQTLIRAGAGAQSAKLCQYASTATTTEGVAIKAEQRRLSRGGHFSTEVETARALRDLAGLIGAERVGLRRPFMVAIDGRSGVGKSTFVRALAELTDAAVIDGDDFFAGGPEVGTDPPAARAERCIDWRRLRGTMETLREGRSASYCAFNWEAFDGSLRSVPTLIETAHVVIVEGVYTARPELADLLDLRVLVRVPDRVRDKRLLKREGTIGPWETQWHEAEDWYFAAVAPPTHFDRIVDNH
jgi:uridine kinase